MIGGGDPLYLKFWTKLNQLHWPQNWSAVARSLWDR